MVDYNNNPEAEGAPRRREGRQHGLPNGSTVHDPAADFVICYFFYVQNKKLTPSQKTNTVGAGIFAR